MATTRRTGSRVFHALLMLPAFALGVLLLAVFIADRTGAPLGDTVVDLVPASLKGSP